MDVGTRFASGQHAVPPEPVTLTTRWHDPSAKRFWVVVDTPDAQTIHDWMAHWVDSIDWEVNTMLDDEIGSLLGNLLQPAARPIPRNHVPMSSATRVALDIGIGLPCTVPRVLVMKCSLADSVVLGPSARCPAQLGAAPGSSY